MAKLSVSIGLTVPSRDVEYANFRPFASFKDIDVEGDVEAQARACLDAMERVSPLLEQGVARLAADASGLAVEGLGLSREFEAFRERVGETLRRIVAEVKRHKDILDAAAPAPVGAAAGEEAGGKAAPRRPARRRAAEPAVSPAEAAAVDGDAAPRRRADAAAGSTPARREVEEILTPAGRDEPPF